MDLNQFVQALQKDLASEFVAITHYLTYAATIKGINRQELSEYFKSTAYDELEHAQWFADKIAVFGGTPQIVCQPAAEANTPQDMVSISLKLEAQTVQNYTQRVAQAEALGLRALAVDIENILTDELEHRDELAMLLGK